MIWLQYNDMVTDGRKMNIGLVIFDEVKIKKALLTTFYWVSWWDLYMIAGI